MDESPYIESSNNISANTASFLNRCYSEASANIKIILSLCILMYVIWYFNSEISSYFSSPGSKDSSNDSDDDNDNEKDDSNYIENSIKKLEQEQEKNINYSN